MVEVYSAPRDLTRHVLRGSIGPDRDTGEWRRLWRRRQAALRVGVVKYGCLATIDEEVLDLVADGDAAGSAVVSQRDCFAHLLDWTFDGVIPYQPVGVSECENVGDLDFQVVHGAASVDASSEHSSLVAADGAAGSSVVSQRECLARLPDWTLDGVSFYEAIGDSECENVGDLDFQAVHGAASVDASSGHSSGQ